MSTTHRTEINEDGTLVEGWNIRTQNVAGHKSVLCVFVWSDGRARIRHSSPTVRAARQWIRRNG